MAGENTLSTLNGLFKEVYADSLKELLPTAVKLQKTIGFARKGKELGGAYNQPVVLTNEHGFTFNDPGSVGDAFSLNNAVAGVHKNASIKSVEMVLRGQLSYVAASRAKNSAAAFIDTTENLVRNLRTSFTKKLEVELFYGQSGIGTISAVDGQEITITASEWAPGIWSGSEGMPIQIFAAAATSIDDARNGGVAYSSADSKAFRVVSVDIAARTVTVTGTMTGVIATDLVYVAGSFGKEMAGLHKIMTNTGSLFGIDAAVYNIWKGNTYAVATTAKALTFNHISAAIDLAIAKGLDEDVTLYISSKAHTDLLMDNEVKRQIDASYDSNKQVRGTSEFGFVGQNGRVKIVPSIYVKEGYAYLVVDSDFLRIGSTDVTFTRPGQKDTFFMDLQDKAGYELRAYTDQALFCHAPGKQVLISGLVPGDVA